MKQRFTSLSLLAALLVTACMAGTAFAQDATVTLYRRILNSLVLARMTPRPSAMTLRLQPLR